MAANQSEAGPAITDSHSPAGTRPVHDVARGRSPMAWIHGVVSASLLVAGTIVFSWGGNQHPATDGTLGPVGSQEYFRTFAEHVLHTDGWRGMHAALLAGPLLWALGAVGFLRYGTRSADRPGFGHTGVVALAMGAVAWAVVFVIDGFVSPLVATTAADSGLTPASLEPFRAWQEVVARLGLVSWVLIGAGIAALAAAILAAREPGLAQRLIVGLSGLVIGLWPIIATALGEFHPSAFTSDLWRPTAVVTSAWFALASVALIWREIRARRYPNTGSQAGSDGAGV